MGRGHVDQTGGLRQALNAQPLVVHRHRHHPGATGLEHRPRRRVARLLHGHRVPGGHPHPGQQIQALLGALGDQQGLPVAGQPPAVAQVTGDGQAQRRFAARVAVQADVPGRFAQGRHHGPAPGRPGQQRPVGDAAGKVVPARRPPAAPVRQRAPVGTGARTGPLGFPGQWRRHPQHEGAAAGSTTEKPFRHQPLVGLHHQPPGHPQLRRQHTAGRQPFAGRHLTVDQRPAQALVKPLAEAAGPVQGKVNLHGPGPR